MHRYTCGPLLEIAFAPTTREMEAHPRVNARLVGFGYTVTPAGAAQIRGLHIGGGFELLLPSQDYGRTPHLERGPGTGPVTLPAEQIAQWPALPGYPVLIHPNSALLTVDGDQSAVRAWLIVEQLFPYPS